MVYQFKYEVIYCSQQTFSPPTMGSLVYTVNLVLRAHHKAVFEYMNTCRHPSCEIFLADRCGADHALHMPPHFRLSRKVLAYTSASTLAVAGGGYYFLNSGPAYPASTRESRRPPPPWLPPGR